MIISSIRTVLRKMYRLYRRYRPGVIDLARDAQRSHQWKTALALWEKAIIRFPKNVNAHIQRGTVLMEMGRFMEAETIFREASEKWPESKAPLAALAHISYVKRDYEQSCSRWHKAVARFPGDLEIHAAYIRSLLNVLDLDRAFKFYDDASKNTRDPMFLSMLADIHAAEFNWTAALDVVKSLRQAHPDNSDIKNKEVKLLVKGAMGLNVSDPHGQAIAILEPLEKTRPWKLSRSLKLAEAYIYANRNDDAIRMINRIPGSFGAHKDVMQLRAWQCHHSGDDAGAKQIWNDLQKRHYIRSVHLPVNSMKRLDSNPMEVKPNDILLFSVMRNELWRMQWFLDYYRKLGVEYFFIVDNGSDDGTSEFLLQQKDVFTFWTDDSFAKAGNGIRWINALVEQYGQEKWCLYVDADEGLVFPGMENFDLHHLTAYMQKKGHEALFAFMLDMHSKDLSFIPDCTPGKDFTADYPYFNNSYNFHGIVNCPYKQVIGGIRPLIFGIPENQTKTPLIRGGRKIKFLTSSHQITPAIVSDVTAVLKHYKMAGDFHDYCLKTISHKTFTSGDKRRHLSYSKTLQTLGQHDLSNKENTEQYESSRQLLELGIISCPDQFLEIETF